jgi:hypothetical protein
MLHYIADKIIQAEFAKGKEKKAIEKECFETILKFWAHRTTFRDTYNPFENYEKIFKVLDKINPDEQDRSFYNQPKIDLKTVNRKNKTSENVNQWLNIALDIDATAKVLLEFVFQQASIAAKSRKTKSILNNISHQTSDIDVKVIIKFIDHVDNNEKLEEKMIDGFKKRIDMLDRFNKVSSNLKKVLKVQYSSLIKKNSPKMVTKPKRK